MTSRGSTGAIKKGRNKDKSEDDKQKKIVMLGERITTQKDREEVKEEGNKVGKGKDKEVRFDIDDMDTARKEMKIFILLKKR